MTAIQRSYIAMLATTLRNFAEDPLRYYVDARSKYSKNATDKDPAKGLRKRGGAARVRPSIERPEEPYGTLQTLVDIYKRIFEPTDKLVPPVPLALEISEYWCDLLDAWKSNSARKKKKAKVYALHMATELTKQYRLGDPIWFDDDSFSVILYGDLYAGLDPIGYCLLRILAKIRSLPITTKQIIETIETGAIPLDVGHGVDNQIPFVRRVGPLPEIADSADKVIDRGFNDLPPELRKLIPRATKKGRCMVLTDYAKTTPCP